MLSNLPRADASSRLVHARQTSADSYQTRSRTISKIQNISSHTSETCLGPGATPSPIKPRLEFTCTKLVFIRAGEGTRTYVFRSSSSGRPRPASTVLTTQLVLIAVRFG